jgi:3-methyladenine DNA glycosylase AlkC
MGESFREVVAGFDIKNFVEQAEAESKGLPFKEKTGKIGAVLRRYLPSGEEAALQALRESLGPKLNKTENNGLKVMFYMPHSHLLASFAETSDDALFDRAVEANFELTSRFTSEFSIRPFLEARFDRCLSLLAARLNDPDPHVRRLISEGTRPRLPWAGHLYHVRKNPTLTLPLLKALKIDSCRYVTRSVANHLADIGKDNLPLLLETCEHWLAESEAGDLTSVSAKELRWVIRHALRYPGKNGNKLANTLRTRAK